MKVVIIYDSTFGNTESIAMAIRDGIGPGHTVNLLRAAAASADDLNGADLLLIGSPTHGGRSTEPVKVFLDNLPAGRLKLATSPRATGSPPNLKTIGIVVVAAFAAGTAAVPPVAITAA